METPRWTDETLCERCGEEDAAPLMAVVPPLYLNSLHTFDTIGEYLDFSDDQDGRYIYGRISNPTVALLEQKLVRAGTGRGGAVFRLRHGGHFIGHHGLRRSGGPRPRGGGLYGPARGF
jgi:cystathionine beta-lyase/cystathionine gamma-synthase